MPKDKPRIRQDTPQDSSVDNLRSRSTGVKVGSKACASRYGVRVRKAQSISIVRLSKTCHNLVCMVNLGSECRRTVQ